MFVLRREQEPKPLLASRVWNSYYLSYVVPVGLIFQSLVVLHSRSPEASPTAAPTELRVKIMCKKMTGLESGVLINIVRASLKVYCNYA